MPATRKIGSKYCSRKCNVADRWTRHNTPERTALYRDINLRRLYGIGAEEFDALLAAQGGVCAICKTNDWRAKHDQPHLDHDHKTGAIRGILCGPCNTGLGHFGEDVERMMAAIAYLSASGLQRITTS